MAEQIVEVPWRSGDVEDRVHRPASPAVLQRSVKRRDAFERLSCFCVAHEGELRRGQQPGDVCFDNGVIEIADDAELGGRAGGDDVVRFGNFPAARDATRLRLEPELICLSSVRQLHVVITAGICAGRLLATIETDGDRRVWHLVRREAPIGIAQVTPEAGLVAQLARRFACEGAAENERARRGCVASIGGDAHRDRIGDAVTRAK